MIAPITKHLIFLASLVTVTWTILNLVLVYIDRDAAVATNPLGLVVHALVWLLGLVVTNVGFLLFRKLQLREESAIKRLVASEQKKAEEELVAVRQGAEQGLRESEARYRFVTENMSDVLWLLDAKTLRFEYISPSVERLLGFTVEEAMQQSPFEALTAEYHHLIGDDYRKRIHAFEAGDQTMKVKTHRINQPRKGGDTVPVELVTTLILGPDGLVQYVQGISRDITERLELEKGLHQRENDYGVFISATMDGVLETNLQGTILTTNDAYCKMLGFKKEELVGQHMSSLEGNENEGEVRRHAELIRATGSDRFETRHRRKDGSLIDVVLQVTHVSTRNVLVAFVHDISELKQQNLALKESEERARRVIENAGAGYFQLDREGHFVEVNGAWLTMHGFVSAGEVLGTHFIHTQVAVDVAYVEGVIEKALKGEEVPAGELAFVRKDGTTGWHSFSLHPVKRKGAVVGVEGFLIDISELRHAQADYKMLFNKMLDAFALHEIICDENHKPVDYRFLSVNPAFERMTGLRSIEVIGKRVLEVMPSIEPHWIKTYGEVALTGKSVKLENFSKDLGKYFEVEAFCPSQGRFACTFVDITANKQAQQALLESEERFRSIIGVMSEGIVIHGSDGSIVHCNRSADQILGLTHDQLLGRTSADPRFHAIREDGRPFPAEDHPAMLALAHGRSVRNVAMGLTNESGALHWINVNAEPLFHPGDTLPYAACASFVDITERRKSEIELRKLSRAIEQSPVSVVVTDHRGAIEYVNPRFCVASGYSSAEVIGHNPRVMKSGLMDEAIYKQLWNTIRSGKEWRGELLNKRKNGDLFWEFVSISPIFDEHSTISHYIAVKEDITARKQAEQHIIEQAALIQATSDAIIVCTLSRKVTVWNRAAEEIYGWMSAEILGKDLETVLPLTDHRRLEQNWTAFLVQGTFSSEATHSTKAGKTVRAQVRAKLLRGEKGEPKAALIVITDITEAKRLESQFLRAQRLESLGSLASGVAHDLNNVLTPIMMSVEMLREMAKNEQDKSLLKIVKDSASRGAGIVKQLLIFGRGSDTPRADMNLGGVVHEVVRMMKETFPKNISIEEHCAAGLWHIVGDRTQMHQVVLNLCVNARDAMPGGGTLSVLANNTNVDEFFAKNYPEAKPGPHIRIQVVDTGSGISPEHLDKIFDPFFTTKPQGQGTGLGLSTVLGIVRSHGGFIIVNSKETQGTDFSIYIPASLSVSDEELEHELSHSLMGQGQTILVIDDEAVIREMLQRALPDYNYKVMLAADGTEAIALLAQNVATIDLVITDMMMPVMDGVQAIVALRRLNPYLPILAMSGIKKHRVDLETFPGANISFLQKPFTVEQLVTLAKETLDVPLPPH